jgi:hypothetical protein
MFVMYQHADELCVDQRLAAALRATDPVQCGDMIDGAIEIARRRREEGPQPDRKLPKDCDR